MNDKTNKTAEKVREELALLELVRKRLFSGAHYETVVCALERVGFPYELVQTERDDLGKLTRNYRYYWRSRWGNGSALYINETDAGRYACPGITDAIKRLRRTLEAFAE